MSTAERGTVTTGPRDERQGKYGNNRNLAEFWVNYFTRDTKRLWSERDYRILHAKHTAAMVPELVSVYMMGRTAMPEKWAFYATTLVAAWKSMPLALRIGQYHVALEQRRRLQKADTYGPRSVEDLIGKFDHFQRQVQDIPDEFKDAILEHRFGPIFESELLSLGFQPMKGRADKKKTRAFQKENDPDLPTDKFSIINNKEGQWLLKFLSRNPLRATYQEAVEIIIAQEEVDAYKVAEAVGYPVPETRKVIHKGQPAIAYSYLLNAVDSYAYGDRAGISNPDDVVLRPWFNALIGAFGDSAHQGIVDQVTGKYHANDIRYTLERFVPGEISDDQDMAIARAGLSEEAGNRGYGVPEPLEPTQSILAFLERVKQLGGNETDQDKFPPRLRQRARTVSTLMEEALSRS